MSCAPFLIVTSWAQFEGHQNDILEPVVTTLFFISFFALHND